MDVEELTAALTRHKPDPDAVLASFRAKREDRRGLIRRRIIVTVTPVLVAAVVVALVGILRHGGEAGVAADGCGYDPLPRTFSDARKGGASVVVAKGSLTGRVVTPPAEATYHQMALTSVRTLSGPTIHSGTTGWITGHDGSDPITDTDAGPLWGTDGSLFAIVWPNPGNPPRKGPILRVAPVVDGNVVFGAVNGCWDTRGLPTRPFHGPLASIPGSDAYARGVKAGLQAVPLATVEKLAAQ